MFYPFITLLFWFIRPTVIKELPDNVCTNLFESVSCFGFGINWI